MDEVPLVVVVVVVVDDEGDDEGDEEEEGGADSSSFPWKDDESWGRCFGASTITSLATPRNVTSTVVVKTATRALRWGPFR